MNIFVIFLLLIFILLMLKIKLSIYFKFDNFETYIRIKGRFINFERKGSLILRKKKYILEKRFNRFIKNKSIDKEKLMSILKYVEVDKLNINLLFGAILLLPTIFSAPVFSVLLEYIKIAPFKKLKQYNYNVMPIYDKPKLFFEIEAIVYIRIVDLIRIRINF